MVADQPLALLFPGQGSQCQGMGRDLYESFGAAREVFDEASDALHLDMRWLCFEAPEEVLVRPSYARPAICAMSLAALRVLTEEVGGLAPAYLAGHSLGEYTADVVAGVTPFPVMVRLLQTVGAAMERIPGMMAALVGLSRTQVVALCRAAARAGVVTPAGFNAPGQIVISGEVSAVGLAMELAGRAGATAIVPLAVGAPCHSPLMAPVGEALREALAGVPFAPASVRVVSNVSATIHTGGALARELLVRQLAAPVEWALSIQSLLTRRVSTFIEVGPGRVLTGLLRRQAPGAAAFAVWNVSSLWKAIARMERHLGASRRSMLL